MTNCRTSINRKRRQRLVVEWKNIPLNYLKKITGNMSKHLRYIIEVKVKLLLNKILIIVYVNNFEIL